MYKLISILTVIGLLAFSGSAFAKDDKPTEYWVKGNVKVLAFIGDPNTLDLETIQYTTSESQKVKLFHKKSGPGVYACYLKRLMVKDATRRIMIRKEGYFLVKKRHLQKVK